MPQVKSPVVDEYILRRRKAEPELKLNDVVCSLAIAISSLEGDQHTKLTLQSVIADVVLLSALIEHVASMEATTNGINLANALSHRVAELRAGLCRSGQPVFPGPIDFRTFKDTP